jgi:hypothetical protein
VSSASQALQTVFFSFRFEHILATVLQALHSLTEAQKARNAAEAARDEALLAKKDLVLALGEADALRCAAEAALVKVQAER